MCLRYPGYNFTRFIFGGPFPADILQTLKTLLRLAQGLNGVPQNGPKNSGVFF